MYISSYKIQNKTYWLKKAVIITSLSFEFSHKVETHDRVGSRFTATAL
jgi:hypothetical protein